MDGVVSAESMKKRRLPLWMIDGANQVKKSAKREEAENASSNPKSSSTGDDKGKEVSVQTMGIGESSLTVNCQSKRKERKFSRKFGSDKRRRGKIENAAPEGGGIRRRKRKGQVSSTEDEEGSDDEIYITCRSPNAEKTAAQKTQNASFRSGVSSSNEKDGDLTVEDMMAIAQEIIKNNNGSRRTTQKYWEEDEDKEMARIESGGVIEGVPGDSTNLAEVEEASFQSTGDKGSVISLSKTGDVAQDMLQLFLGPLLKKPVEDMKVDLITQDINDALPASRDQKGICGVEVEPPAVMPRMKKKSSLRDKVAAFLD